MPPKRRPRARDGGAQAPPSSVAGVCKFYNEGNCRYGENCKFLHSASQGLGDGSALRPVPAPMDANTTLCPLQVSYGVADLQAPVIKAGSAVEIVVQGQGLGPPGQHGTRSSSQLNSGTPTPGLPTQEGAHSQLPAKAKAKKTKPCFAFQGTGKCEKGDSCRYSHAIKIVRVHLAIERRPTRY